MYYKQSIGSTACPAVHLAYGFPCCYSSNTNKHQTALYSLDCTGFIFCSCLCVTHLCFSAFTFPWAHYLCFMVLYPIFSPTAYGISQTAFFYKTGATCVPHEQLCKIIIITQNYLKWSPYILNI